LSISIKKLGILAVMATLLVVLAALRPTAQTPVAQADLAAPGGIAALPSAAPAIPGVANQGIPAIIGTGQPAIIVAFCSDFVAPGALLSTCVDPLTFTITRVYPSGDPMATFAASGTSELVLDDNGGGDMDSADGVVAVELDAAAATQGGTKGVNEILKVTVQDGEGGGCSTCALGVARSVNVVVVDTMLAWGPTGQVSTASQEQPVFVSYHCDSLGRAPISDISATLGEGVAGDGDGSQGLDDMYDGLYGPYNGTSLLGPLGNGWGSNTLTGDADFSDVWCGGNSGSMFDDFVDFQTDKGLFSLDPTAVPVEQASVNLAVGMGFFFPPSLDPFCDAGKTIDDFDIDALSVWGAFIVAPLGASTPGGCDLDGWRNGVVTDQLVGNGEVGVATITAQQGGGVTTPRTINVTFAGAAALSLFIKAPASIGLTGGDFTVTVVDQNGVPVGDTTVQCTVDPASGALALLNQTGTTGAVSSANPGQVTFTLLPTGASVVAGAELTLTCVLDRDHSVSATTKVTLSTTPNLESVALVEGCNPIAATWPNATAIATVSGAVTPATALEAIWKFDPATSTWKGFSPSAPAAVSDLASVDRLDAIFICVNAAATVNRPVI
jgi:hypothetical protein